MPPLNEIRVKRTGSFLQSLTLARLHIFILCNREKSHLVFMLEFPEISVYLWKMCEKLLPNNISDILPCLYIVLLIALEKKAISAQMTFAFLICF